MERLQISRCQEKGLNLYMLRGDLVHPVISGNKLWKLRYNLEKAIRLGKERLITFGGAYSNHLLAVACATHGLGMKSVGIVRGDEPMNNRILEKCRDYGMQLIQVPRNEYRDKEKVLADLFPELEGTYVLPEGGSNALAVKGCAEAIPQETCYDHIFVATGTGGTLAGLAQGASMRMPGCVVEGIAVLKGVKYLEAEIEAWVPGLKNWKLHFEMHQGGYGKTPPSLLEFMRAFREETNISLDPIYTAKMMAAVLALTDANYFQRGASILCVHTGGNY